MSGILYAVTVGLVTSLQTSGRRYSVCILDTFKIGFVYILQLTPDSDSVTERCCHSLSALQLSPHSVLLVIFGGWRSLDSHKLSHTALIELSEYYINVLSMQYSSYSDRHALGSGTGVLLT